MDQNRRFGARRGERRKADRNPVGIPVSLHSISQSRVVMLHDVSTTGARIGGLNLPAVGKDVLLKIAGVELFGTLVRSGPNDAAMTFERAIGARELQKLRALAEEAEATIEERAEEQGERGDGAGAAAGEPGSQAGDGDSGAES